MRHSLWSQDTWRDSFMGIICSESTLPFAWLSHSAPLLIQEHLLGARLCGAFGDQNLGDIVVPAFEKSAEGQCTEQVWSACVGWWPVWLTGLISPCSYLPLDWFPAFLLEPQPSLPTPTHDAQGLRSLYLVLSAPTPVLYPFLLLCGGHRRLWCPQSIRRQAKSRAWSLDKGETPPVCDLIVSHHLVKSSCAVSVPFWSLGVHAMAWSEWTWTHSSLALSTP